MKLTPTEKAMEAGFNRGTEGKAPSAPGKPELKKAYMEGYEEGIFHFNAFKKD